MVIQRWQSVMLLIAAVMMACFTFFSLGQWQTTDYTLNFTTLGFKIEGIPTDGSATGYYMHTWYFFIISLTSFIIPLIDIFLFKNLRLQRTLCLVELLFIATVMGVGAVLGYNSFEYQSMGWSSLIIAPFIAFFAVMIAYKLIGRDKKLLTSLDRLR